MQHRTNKKVTCSFDPPLASQSGISERTHHCRGDVEELEALVGAVNKALVSNGNAFADLRLLGVGQGLIVDDAVVDTLENTDRWKATANDVLHCGGEALELAALDGVPEGVDGGVRDLAGDLLDPLDGDLVALGIKLQVDGSMFYGLA